MNDANDLAEPYVASLITQAVTQASPAVRKRGGQVLIESVSEKRRGVDALYLLRALVGLTRATAVVGALGSGYEDAAGIRPGLIAR